MTDMATLLLTGATGFLGRNILKELEEPSRYSNLKIKTIRLLVRNPGKVEVAKSATNLFEIVMCDLTNPQPEDLQKATASVDIVIHTAALYSIHGKWNEFYKANVIGTRLLIEHLPKGCTFVLTSTYGIYGFNAGAKKPITESHEPKRPFWHYQRSKKMQEDLARELCHERGINFVAIRPPNIIGAGDITGAFNVMKNLEKKRIFLLRDGKGWIPIAHPRDVARAHLLAAGKAQEFNGEAFHLAPFHVTFRDYVNAYAEELGLKPVNRKAPYSLLYAFAWILDRFPFRHDITRFGVKFLGSSDQLDTSKIEQKLGFKANFTFNQTIEEAANWYKSLKPPG